MAKHITLEHVFIQTADGARRFEPGEILDDAAHDIAPLLEAGVALVPLDPSLEPLVAKFRGRTRREGDPYGDVLAVLLREQAASLSMGRLRLVSPSGDAFIVTVSDVGALVVTAE